MSNSSSSSSTSPYNFSLTADIVFGVVELTSSFLAFFLNSLTVRFFFGKKKSPTYFLYLCIVTVDILTGLVTFPSGISMVFGRKRVLFRNSFLCILSGWVLNITTRMSVYLVAVLSVIRCITIHPTLSSPSFRHAVFPVIVYLFIQVGQASLPLMFSSHSPPIYFHESVGACSWGIDDLTIVSYEDGQGFWYQFLVYFCLVIPSLLPIIPVLVCCGIFVKIVLSSKQRLLRYTSHNRTHVSSYSRAGSVSNCNPAGVSMEQQPGQPQQFLLPKSITKSSNINTDPLSSLHVSQSTLPRTPEKSTICNTPSTKQTNRNLSVPQSPGSLLSTCNSNNGSRRQGAVNGMTHQATTTMYIVTTLYVVFNVPFWIFLLIVMFFGQSDHITWVTRNYAYIHIFVYRTSVAMNAACNPIVYFTRMQALRRLWTPKNAACCARNLLVGLLPPYRRNNKLKLNSIS